MGTVIPFPISQPMTCVETAQRLFAAMPSWITGCPPLNRDITHLQKSGWMVLVMHDGEVLCSHPKVVSLKKIALHDALCMQRFIDRQ